MITAIIIDDEKHAREFLDKLIKRYFNIKLQVLELCDSVNSGILAINTFNPDIVFLDIQMPNENGFELFKKIEKITFEVIFTTAHKDYAINAIKYGAFDYLLKPINQIDLLSVLKRYEIKKSTSQQRERLSIVLDNLQTANNSFNKIAFPTQTGYDLISLNSILYCKSDSNYCKVILVGGKEILLAKTLKYVEQLINSSIFFRVHKSFLVNLNYIQNFNKLDELSIIITNGEKIPVSVRKKESFLNALTKKT